MSALARVIPERRTSPRTPLSGKVACQYDSKEQCLAEWRDIGLKGARIRLGRYIAPGKHLLLLPAPGSELKARVVWCLPREGSQYFEAGLRIYPSEHDAFRIIESLFAKASAK